MIGCLKNLAKRGLVTTTRVHSNQSTLIKIDDKKVNSLTLEIVQTLKKTVFESEQNSKALLLIGNSRAFSSGLDLKTMTKQGKEKANELVNEACKLGLQLLESPLPIFMGAHGHALGMGSILLLCGDYTYASNEISAKIGLHGVKINVTLPDLALKVAKTKMSPSKVHSNLLFGNVFSPMEAKGSNGFVDEIIDSNDYDDFVAEFVKKSEETLQSLKQPSFSEIKNSTKMEMIKSIKTKMLI